MVNDPSELTIFSEIVLEKIRASVGLEVSGAFLATIELRCIEDYIANKLLIQLRSNLWGKEVSRLVEATQKFSATWWDHFKVTFFPPWLYKRYPARFVIVDTVVKHYHTCPHLNLLTTKTHLHFLSTPDDEPVFGGPL